MNIEETLKLEHDRGCNIFTGEYCDCEKGIRAQIEGYADAGVLLITPDRKSGIPIVEWFGDEEELERAEQRLPN